MQGWLKITLVAVSSGILLSLLFAIIIVRACCLRRRRERFEEQRPDFAGNLHSGGGGGLSELHHVSLQRLDRNGTKKTDYFVFRRGPSSRPNFNWADHPHLITDAVENGWSQFGFSVHTPPRPASRSARSLLSSCTAGDTQTGVNIRWEASPGTTDFMQKIRFRCNPELLKRIASSRNKSSSMAAAAVIKTSLPFPGPPSGTSSFPQEAYFEITVLPLDQDDGRKSQDDKITLIGEDYNAKSLAHVTSSDEGRKGNKRNNDQHVWMSIGLTGSGFLPMKIPGSYPGSIGFNSNGSVCLDGMMLVYEGEEWGRTERVIGCGYNPIQKKVFFTLDSQLMHEVHCKSHEFGSPLYPTIAANSADVLVVVNLGQRAFKYAPANLQRTPNPSIAGPPNNPSAIGYYDEDSKELFSIGRIDSHQWMNRSTTAEKNNNTNNNNGVNGLKQHQLLDFDFESEEELFEIVLDSSGKIPKQP
ncbi:unnamed protein product [Cuscuta campestris]|uniref:SPRY domain-containing protein n=1 Tax=Cuscuta campestris TaxID=132261 RepID=A0A484KLL0_9ASTE|nr:unnamed protein product [Cuscuta campestris]